MGCRGETFVGVKSRQPFVAERDDLEQIVPGVFKGIVRWLPRVQIEVLPKTAVVPVTAADGDDGLVGGERVVVVHPAIGTLQSLALTVAANIIIERADSIDVEIVG